MRGPKPKKANKGLLKGLRCPKQTCRSLGPFEIRCSAMLTVHDDGMVHGVREMEWGDHSTCVCKACFHMDHAICFQTRHQKR